MKIYVVLISILFLLSCKRSQDPVVVPDKKTVVVPDNKEEEKKEEEEKSQFSEFMVGNEWIYLRRSKGDTVRDVLVDTTNDVQQKSTVYHFERYDMKADTVIGTYSVEISPTTFALSVHSITDATWVKKTYYEIDYVEFGLPIDYKITSKICNQNTGCTSLVGGDSTITYKYWYGNGCDSRPTGGTSCTSNLLTYEEDKGITSLEFINFSYASSNAANWYSKSYELSLLKFIPH